MPSLATFSALQVYIAWELVRGPTCKGSPAVHFTIADITLRPERGGVRGVNRVVLCFACADVVRLRSRSVANVARFGASGRRRGTRCCRDVAAFTTSATLRELQRWDDRSAPPERLHRSQGQAARLLPPLLLLLRRLH